MFSSPEKNSKKVGQDNDLDNKEINNENQEVSTFKNNVNSKETVERNNELRQNLGRGTPKTEKSEAFDWDEGQKRIKK